MHDTARSDARPPTGLWYLPRMPAVHALAVTALALAAAEVLTATVARAAASTNDSGHRTEGTKPPAMRVIDRFDDVTAWSLNPDNGDGATVQSDTKHARSPKAAMRFVFKGNRWANLRRPIAVPPNAVALSCWAKVHHAAAKAAMYVWLIEPDRDGHLGRAQVHGKNPAEWGEDWVHIRIPIGRFRHQPRGDRKPALLSANRILIGAGHAPLDVTIDDLIWELRSTQAKTALPATRQLESRAGKLGRVMILDEPTLAPPYGRAGLDWLARVLVKAGFGVTRCRAGDLADAKRLSREHVDLLVLGQGERFPVEAWPNVRAFLKAGGSLLTAGGYAFDKPVVFDGQAWHPAGTLQTAAEVQTGTPSQTRINTRFGQPGDWVRFDPSQIGMFDPSYEMLHVTRAQIDKTRIPGPLTGFVACITDPTGSPVFGKAHLRFEPLGMTYDALGRSRGALGGIAHHFAGPYAGSSWAFFGVDNRDLFAPGVLPDTMLIRLARRLVDQVYLHRLGTDLACYRDGEAVRVHVHIANRGRGTHRPTLRVSADDQIIHDAPLDLPPDRGTSKRIEATWQPGTFDRDVYRIRAALTLDGRTDTLDSAFCAWRDTTIAAGPEIALEDNYLRINDRPTLLTGTNQTGRVWLSEYENPLIWEREFAGMRDHGLTTWRVLHFSPVMDNRDPLALTKPIPKKVLRQTDALVMLAQKYGRVVFLTMHDWMPVELTEQQLAAQATWNAFWADRYKDVPGILYDIQNEPAMRITDAPHIVASWRQYLTRQHGSVAAAAKRWGLEPNDLSATQPTAAGKSWTDLKAVDVERFRVHLLNRWVKGNADPIRRADPGSLVVVGYLQRMRPADKVLGARHVDIANMHSYLPPRAFPADFKIIDRRAVGKTLSLGEYGHREAHDARTHGQTGDRPVESLRRFMIYNHYVFGLGGSWTASWCWRDMPDCVFPWGMTWVDQLPKPVLQAYRNITLTSRFIEPRYVAPRVWLILPDAHRLGPMWSEIHAAIERTIDALLGLRVEFGVLRERDMVEGVLAKQTELGSPAVRNEPILIWPIPYCPDDATFVAVRRAVEEGAVLYASGDLVFDEQRRPTKLERLAALGLHFAEHPLPPMSRHMGALLRLSVGRGRVLFMSAPVQFHDSDRLVDHLDGVLDLAGAPRIPVEPQHPDLHAMVTHGRGMTVHHAVNHGTPREPYFSVAGTTVRLPLAAPGWGLVAVNDRDEVIGVQAQGPVRVGNRQLVDASHDVTVIAVDGVDLGRSKRLLVMPSFAGKVTIATSATWRRPVATVGEVVDGRFQAYRSPLLDASHGALRLDVAPCEALTPVLITEQDDAGAAGELIAALLTLGE